MQIQVALVVARGPVVEEAALIAALGDGTIAGAGLLENIRRYRADEPRSIV